MPSCTRFACLVALLVVVAHIAAPSQDAGSETDKKANAARTSWFQYGRVAPKGHSAAEYHLRAHQLRSGADSKTSISTRTGQPAAGYAGTGWIPLGPAPLASDASEFGLRDYSWVSGRATSVAIDRTDATGNTVYVGGAYGGVWKSTNAAAPLSSDVIWTPLFDDQPTLAIGAVAIKPGSSSVVLAGTGETNSSTDSYYGLGIFAARMPEVPGLRLLPRRMDIRSMDSDSARLHSAARIRRWSWPAPVLPRKEARMAWIPARLADFTSQAMLAKTGKPHRSKMEVLSLRLHL